MSYKIYPVTKKEILKLYYYKQLHNHTTTHMLGLRQMSKFNARGL